MDVFGQSGCSYASAVFWPARRQRRAAARRRAMRLNSLYSGAVSRMRRGGFGPRGRANRATRARASV